MHRLLSFVSCLKWDVPVFNYHFFSFQTENCGWGVEAAESINKGDFIIEYVGEGNVIKLLLLQFCPNIHNLNK